MHFFGLSDVGRKRTGNEDRLKISNEKQYVILADGMGGREFGEVASEMAVDMMARHIEDDLPSSLFRLERADQGTMAVNLLDEWIRHVNAEIFSLGQRDDRYREMGTTLVAALILDRQCVMAHVGDSRGYRFAPQGLEQLTEDHSFVNSQVKLGAITAEEARESAARNIITRAMGTSEKVKPDIQVHDLSAGDRILLCTDGLSDMVTDEQVVEILTPGAPLEESARELVDAANRAGGKDNITVILGEYED
jgi:protein phosphatase